MSQEAEPPRAERPRPSPPIDPWEARERERARYSAAASSSGGRSRRPGGREEDEPLHFRVASYLAAGLVAAVAALLLGETYHVPAELRSLLTVGGSVLVLLLFASVRSYADDLRIALRRGPNPFLLGMMLWAGFAYFLSPYRVITSFGASELLRVLTGVGVYFLAAYGLRSPKEIANATVGAIGLAVLMALADFWLAGQSGGVLGAQVRDRNLFGTHENLGALMLLALPLAVSFSLSAETEEKRRLAAQAATLVLGAALLLTRARSAWIGTVFALLLVALLTAWTRPRAARTVAGGAASGYPVRRGLGALVDLLLSPAGLIVLGLLAVIAFGGAATVLKGRASVHNVLRDPDLDGRVSVWRAASRMAYERPWTGWGLGSYWLIQGRWTHVGADVAEVLSGGAYQDNNAHDYYVQWAADTGAPGLFLYGGAVAAFLVAGGTAVVALRRRRDEKPAAGRPAIPPFQRTLLLGCVASIAGASLDAVASPAYVFHGISALFWLVAGLGIAAMRPVVAAVGPHAAGEDAPAPIPALPPVRLLQLTAAVLPALALVGIVLYAGHRQVALGAHVLRGALGVRADAVGPVVPGQRVTWRALYRDADGRDQSTSPGVIWEFAADRKTVESFRLLRLDTSDKTTLAHGGLSVAPSGAEPTVAVHAIYTDAYGRRYDAWSVLNVARRGKGAPTPHRSAPLVGTHRR